MMYLLEERKKERESDIGRKPKHREAKEATEDF
jgi:hypothetical protein